MTSDKKHIEGWQDTVELVVAFWLCASPFVLGFVGNPTATATAVLIGSFAIFIMQLGIAQQEPWEEWVNLLLAGVLIASPWLFGYSDASIAVVNAIACGSIIILFAIASMIHEYGELKSDRSVNA